MGKLVSTRERVTVAIELSRILGAPALLWNDEKQDWEKSDHTVREMFMQLLWIRLCHAHPELGNADLYENVTLAFNPQTLCVEVDFVRKQKVSDAGKVEQEHGTLVLDVGVPA